MPDMGRKRQTETHLPARMYRPARMHYFVDRKGVWHKLSRDYPTALRLYAAFMVDAGDANTVAALIGKYSAEELQGKSVKTVRGRLQEFKPLAKAFGKMTAEEVEPHHVWNYFKARGQTEQCRHEVRALSMLLTYARRIGARTRPNPCFGLQLPRAAPRDRYVTDDEFTTVRGLAPPMIAHAMDLSYMLGMDQGTVRTLERRHFVDDNTAVVFERSKTAKADRAPKLQRIEGGAELAAMVKEILLLKPHFRQVLIANRAGEAYSLNGFQSQWRRVMAKAVAAGVASFHFHDIRHKSASDAGSDQEAADRLGHGDPALTRKVYRNLPRLAKAQGKL